MEEPRGNLHVQLGETLGSTHPTSGRALWEDNTVSEGISPALEHDLPTHPVHNGLEYEVLVGASSVVTSPLTPVPPLATALNRDKDSYGCGQTNDWKLILSFICLVISGSANVVMTKLQAIPMFNYPIFLNLWINIMYIPICFAYILPVSRFGWFRDAIPLEHTKMSKKPFVIMGALDCFAYSMQIFASVYLPGPLLVLLPQAAIPISMVLSRYVLQERFHRWQYLGAAIVLAGIAIVLEPVLRHRHAPDFYCEAVDVDHDCTICKVELTQETCLSHRRSDVRDVWKTAFYINGSHTQIDALCQWLPSAEAEREEEFLTAGWSLVIIASCIPMALSTIYKQIALSPSDNNMTQEAKVLDPIFMNGWIAVFQLLFSIVVSVPAGMVSSPSIAPWDVPRNLWDGFRCYDGHGTIETGCHVDDACSNNAAFFVNLALIANLTFTFFTMYILKYGSTALLFLALTVMVPIGNLAFSLPFMPQATTLHVSDILGLAIILCGLVLYRIYELPGSCDDDLLHRDCDPNSNHGSNDSTSTLREPLLVQTGEV